jgi:hypothetical protein
MIRAWLHRNWHALWLATASHEELFASLTERQALSSDPVRGPVKPLAVVVDIAPKTTAVRKRRGKYKTRKDKGVPRGPQKSKLRLV